MSEPVPETQDPSWDWKRSDALHHDEEADRYEARARQWLASEGSIAGESS